MASPPTLPPARHVPFKQGGWGAAIATLLAAAGFWTGAWAIHHKTYRPPTDVMMRQVGEDADRTGAQDAGPVPGAPSHGGVAPGSNTSATQADEAKSGAAGAAGAAANGAAQGTSRRNEQAPR